MNRFHWLSCSVLGTLLAFAGCNSPTSPAKTTVSTEATTEPADDSVVLVSLKAADLLDGTEDKVISKCYVCGLGMDGSAEHSAEYEGYSCQLCSEHCKEHFAENAAKVVAETKVPAADSTQ